MAVTVNCIYRFVWRFSSIAIVNTFDGMMQFEISDTWQQRNLLHPDSGLDSELYSESIRVNTVAHSHWSTERKVSFFSPK